MASISADAEREDELQYGSPYSVSKEELEEKSVLKISVFRHSTNEVELPLLTLGQISQPA